MFLDIIVIFNVIVAIVFTAFYSYQLIYILVSLFFNGKNDKDNGIISIKNYAVLIAARNESNVISQLITSIQGQSYPQDSITIFVIADNCTDNTADIARNAGAVVYERFNKNQVGKGYALNFLFGKIFEAYPQNHFDGFFVFDADNLLDVNYISEMNKTFCDGHKIITSYRNTKNYADNWLSAGYSLWFLRESKYMNNPRMILGTGCAISGTGFLVSADIIIENGGWPFHLLTEDIEFSNHNAIEGNRIAYCKTAIFYDEQPTTFRQSWNQRMRWTKGFYQVFGKYGTSLIKTMFKKRSFYAFDMFMTILPGMVLTSVTMSLNIAVSILGAIIGFDISAVINLFLTAILTLYILLFTIGSITVITEWKMIHCRAFFKIAYLFTFPLFMLTYIPIAMVAIFKRVEWKPIGHNSVTTPCGIRPEQVFMVNGEYICPISKNKSKCPPGCIYYNAP
ncbi:MAG: glycosyltransferase [Defluviitaleaceae bacterium]|nr:glycosyltransferase [Defluviitaleaceae bacterium]